jgi:hypothetical protein
MDVLTNHLLLQIESNNLKLSCIRFVVSSSTSTFEYEKDKETLSNYNKNNNKQT